MDRSQKEEKWLAREIQLSQKHAELLAKREQLLHLSQSELNSSEHRAKVHQAHWTHVQQRNKQLLQDIKRSQVEMKDIARQPPNVKFTELQTMYWTTVQDQLPQWKKQMKDKGPTSNSPYM
ncbi:uncharacterized protein C3orf14-like [Branchiostoma floridae]|uniref:Uncharacterized protein C3orf14-like n=1 Tax=Branchiostoma floridae TaxID=7739 RepID=A0A9J7NAU0_BRAFL|nr:uncharacterized protein C3orf14-like [Branchiostoma floridae]